MRLKEIIGGPISATVLLSIPVSALLALSPWSSASPVNSAMHSSIPGMVSGEPAASGSGKIEELGDWKYTDKSMKSDKSEKSKKSPKSKKSKKSKKSDKSKKSHKPNQHKN